MSTAAPPFDPYREWLGIEPHEQPADFYRLMGVARFESNPAVIAAAADQRMALLRSFQTGPRAVYTQRLLNELAAARIALLSPAGKANYDAALARHLAARIASTANAPAYAQPGVPGVLTFGIVQAATAPPAPPVLPPAVPTPVAPRVSLEIDAPPDEAPSAPVRPAPWWQPLLLVVGVALVALAAVVIWSVYQPDLLGTANQSDGELVTPDGGDAPLGPAQARPKPASRPVVLLQEGSGQVVFSPATAIRGGSVELEIAGTEEVLTSWTTANDSVEWHFKLVKPGFFQAEIVYATIPSAENATLELTIGERTTACELRSSGGLDQFITDAFTVFISASGEQTLVVRPADPPEGEWLVLKSVRLMPVGADKPAEPAEQ